AALLPPHGRKDCRPGSGHPAQGRIGNITGWVSSNSDITERKRAEARLSAEHAVTRVLANAASLEAAVPGILDALLGSLEVDVAALWVPSPEQDSLRLVDMNSRDSSPKMRAFIDASKQAVLKPGAGLPGV